jgi:superfamily II RNA helicase
MSIKIKNQDIIFTKEISKDGYNISSQILELINYINNDAPYLINPVPGGDNLNKITNNVKILVDIITPVYLYNLYENTIKNYSKKPGPLKILYNFIKPFTESSENKVLTEIDRYIQILNEEILLQAKKDVFETVKKESLKLFETKRKTTDWDSILTEVKFNSKIITIIKEQIGTVYDIDYFDKINKLKIKFPKVETYITIKQIIESFKFKGDIKKISKNKIQDFISNLDLNLFKQKLFDFANEEIKYSSEYKEIIKDKNLKIEDLIIPIKHLIEYEKDENRKKILKLDDEKDNKKYINSISKIIKDIFSENIENDIKDCKLYSNILSSFSYQFDPWQIEFIKYVEEGKSVIVQTPTSAGKTFISMIALNSRIQKTKNEENICYVAPTVDLALQTFANMSKSFNYQLSLITKKLSYIPQNKTKIFIGTPNELWLYFKSENIKISIGIFDEIHTISTEYGKLRSEAIGNLINLCDKKQIILLSATLHEKDRKALIDFIKIQNIEQIIYDKRPVPQESYIWNGTTIEDINKISESIKHKRISTTEHNIISESIESIEDINKISESIEDINKISESIKHKRISTTEHNEISEFIEITPKNTFEFLKSIENNLPLLMFESNSKICYEYFEEYLNWIVNEDNKMYSNWYRIANKYNPQIEEYNKIFYTEQVSDKQLAEREKDKIKLINNIEKEINNITKGKKTRELNDILINFNEWKTNAYNSKNVISRIFDMVGPYFYIGLGSRKPETALIENMFKNVKEHNELIMFCEAEGIGFDEVKEILLKISLGLKYGISILIPTMPFVVHFNILRLLSKKSIGVVFTSKDMSMGINYPIKTVCIRSPKLENINIGEYLQMAGRSGRRRLDKTGNIISWNIKNVFKATKENISNIIFPEIGETKGIRISNSLECALEIDKSRLFSDNTKDDIINIKNVTDNITPKVEIKPKKEKIFDDEEYEEYEEYKVNEKQVIKKDITPESSLIYVISDCIDPIATNLEISNYDKLNILDYINSMISKNITDELRKLHYTISDQLNSIKYALQELYIDYHNSSNVDWLNYIRTIFELIHRVQYKQIVF